MLYCVRGTISTKGHCTIWFLFVVRLGNGKLILICIPNIWKFLFPFFYSPSIVLHYAFCLSLNYCHYSLPDTVYYACVFASRMCNTYGWSINKTAACFDPPFQIYVEIFPNLCSDPLSDLSNSNTHTYTYK